MPPIPLNEWREELRQSKKYRHLCPATLERTLEWASRRYPPKECLKATKRKLHQVYGAYWDSSQSKWLERALPQAPPVADLSAWQAFCRPLLKIHASTAERAELLPEFYQKIFGMIGQPRTLLDLGCGLNPLTLPWMGLEHLEHYWAADLDQRLMENLAALGQKGGWPLEGIWEDVLARQEWPTCDCALLFKLLPCLEQEVKGSSASLLQRLPAQWLVISFPTRTLGGHQVGMATHYEQFLQEILGSASWQRLEFPNELVFLVRKQA